MAHLSTSYDSLTRGLPVVLAQVGLAVAIALHLLAWSSGTDLKGIWTASVFALLAAAAVLAGMVRAQTRARRHAEALSGRIALLERQIQDLSIQDPELPVWRRSHMLRVLEAERDLSQRQGRRLAVVMFEIDGFRGLADKHGEQIASQVLRETAGGILRGVQQMDPTGHWDGSSTPVARLDGARFLCMLPDTRLVGANDCLDRVRAQFVAPVRTAAGPMRVSLSASITQFGPEESVDSVLGRASAALVEILRKGRNGSCTLRSAATPPFGVRPSAPIPVARH